MSPLSFEWVWQADHFIFLGLLYVALTILGAGLIYTFFKTWFDLSAEDREGEPPPKIPYRTKYSQY